MLFNPVSQTVVLATDQLFTLPLVVVGGIPAANKVYTHRQSVTSLNYSDTFGLVITTGSGSVSQIFRQHIAIHTTDIYRTSRSGTSLLESVFLSLPLFMETRA